MLLVSDFRGKESYYMADLVRYKQKHTYPGADFHVCETRKNLPTKSYAQGVEVELILGEAGQQAN